MDKKWWLHYGDEVRTSFPGERYSVAAMPGVRKGRFPHFTNSGCAALALAAELGARRIVMLGYDCQRTGGMSHWHGDHGGGLGNAGSLPKWPALFQQLAKHLQRLRVEVVNASRETALTMFPRLSLEQALAEASPE